MNKSMRTMMKSLTSVCAAGMIFQTGGCAVDFNALAASLTTAVINNLISGIVFGAFNLVP